MKNLKPALEILAVVIAVAQAVKKIIEVLNK